MFRDTLLHELIVEMCGFPSHKLHNQSTVVVKRAIFLFSSSQCSSRRCVFESVFVSCFASLEFNQMKSKCRLSVWMRHRMLMCRRMDGAQLCVPSDYMAKCTFDFIIRHSWHRLPAREISSSSFSSSQRICQHTSNVDAAVNDITQRWANDCTSILNK